MHRTYIDASSRETGLEMIAENIVAHASHHLHSRGRTGQPCRSAGLIGTLPPGDHLEIPPEHGLAGRRQTLYPRYEIHVEAAHDDDRGRAHRFRSMPNFLSSSA